MWKVLDFDAEIPKNEKIELRNTMKTYLMLFGKKERPSLCPEVVLSLAKVLAP